MDKEPLLLPTTRAVVAHPRHGRGSRFLLRAAIALGIVAVLVGLADLSSRLATSAFGEDAALQTFAPPAAL